MGELRKDYVLDRWVIISTGRSKRPRQFKKLEAHHVEVDFFAPGNEHMTPPEIGRIGTGSKWQMRWFDNKFPALEQDVKNGIETHNKYFTFSGNYGYHEVVVETPRLDKQLSDLTVKQIETLLNVYCERIDDLSKKPNIKYVCVFKNHGKEGGTSILHSHSQIMALNHIPNEVRNEVEACKRYSSCPYCEIISTEKQSDRRCFENNDFVAFAPYASRFNYEIWVFPKKHARTLKETNLGSLAEIMKKILKKIKSLGADYNYYLHYAPEGDDLHFHIEVAPRLATWAGFELGSGDTINSVSPEDAAKFYRGER
ncbi:DUF4931 domain-containing protein [Candidatus Woesearchaeota archaeon]|nr:DUF4931 domain-containing protein [Candidatus Woesearchaeota archaeon]